ncbi:alpha/beta hydrolase [Alkalitalea saponilacus]|uniref:Lysophospholipase, alpha-beta hydrolase superfamily n=1 Tax=Alkalitalea saponilacus TaxID=889453 RepID=A0A1T5FU51_9BACT|nr:alpha/beta hydrolase [Alkalitalea saponilacus]ASB49495.1 alpha/beta hydrolase [Alkalitalea saponilacus]SKB99682.1 Lysophospholipase, alpha-beta hydrolase superfamily [Alkalitalea saponilacus]
MAISHQTFNLVSRDGTVLQGRYWKPGQSPIATVCLIHGIGEHALRYDTWARRFCDAGFMIYALDYRGHGLSEGNKGHIDHISDLLDDIGALVRRSKRNFGEIPAFLYGHSMGGTLVLEFLVKRRQDFAGAIISSPWLKLIKPPSRFIQNAGKWLDPICPEVTFSTGIKSTHMTSLPQKKENADKDPLMHGRISIRMFNEINKCTESLIEWQNPVRTPLLFLHGISDPLTKPEASESIANKNTQLYKFIGYENTLHEIHNEPIADQAFEDINNWMSQIILNRLPK